MINRSPRTVPISLGLQGAGTYGAFTWGVLDRLLDEEDFVIESISGSSSGAVNAAVLADGYAFGGGRAGAQQALRRFWTAIGQTMSVSPLVRTPMDYFTGSWTLEYSPMYHALEMGAAFHGPVIEAPVSQNPLRNILEALINFDRVRGCEEIALFVAATNIRTGIGRIFNREELDPQRILASACLPTIFAGVEVDSESYWDGSFAANPPLAPFLEHGAKDVIVVQNNPVARDQLPRSMADIGNRANEIAFNISFLREMATLKNGLGVPDERGREDFIPGAARVHLISGLHVLSDYSISSKLNGELKFLLHLHAVGKAAAEEWLQQHRQEVGFEQAPQPGTR